MDRSRHKTSPRDKLIIASPSRSKQSLTPSKSSRKSQRASFTPSPMSAKKKSNSKQVAVSAANADICEKLFKNRERLCNTLDTYTLLIRANHPIRCLEHNSNISVYCETEQKLLCSNCIFNRLQHKYHKVVPVDKVPEKLERDVEVMKRQIEREAETIETLSRKIFDAYEQEQAYAQKLSVDLKQKYESAKIMLEENYLSSQRTLQKTLSDLKVQYETVLTELNQLKGIYRDQLRPCANSVKHENLLLYEHVMCTTVVNQGKFFGNKWKSPVGHIAKLEKSEISKIQFLLTSMEKFLL